MEKEEFYNYVDETSLREKIVNLQRGIILYVNFDNSNEYKREHVGDYFKSLFPDYRIGVHTTEKYISILKLITREEIENNIAFFTKCAIDYDVLANSLMTMLIKKHNFNVKWEFPLYTFASSGDKQRGKLNGWSYVRHGYDFRFENIKTKQKIEASLVCGDQFGELDPMFFSEYILSTLAYQPLPTKIYSNYADGVRILNFMEETHILKSIESNSPGRYSLVLSTKETSHIKPYVYDGGEKVTNTKFNLLQYLKSKFYIKNK